MVQVEIRSILFFFIFIGILLSCSIATQDTKGVKGKIIERHSINSRYCFDQIRDSLEQKFSIHLNKIYSIDYSNFKEDKNEAYFKKFDEFIEFSSDLEAFLIDTKGKPFIILIGKALGATGIGVDYWNYCFGRIDTQKRYEFSSLVKSPFSIFIDESDNLRYVQLDDDYPRSADGKEIILDYFPLVVSIYDANSGQSEFSFDFKCKENIIDIDSSKSNATSVNEINKDSIIDCLPCNIEILAAIDQAEIVEDKLIQQLFCTISKACTDNIEFSEFFNEICYKALANNPEAFYTAFQNFKDKKIILVHLENPVNDAVNLKDLINELNRQLPEGNDINKSIEKAILKY